MGDDELQRILEAVDRLSPEERQALLRHLTGGKQQPRQSVLPVSPEWEGPADYEIVFDGGSHGNPGPAYGSYRLTRLSDGKSRVVRLSWDRDMSNNEAEYETLIAGLEGLLERITSAGRDPAEFTVEVRGDSLLVLRQVEGRWRAKDKRMRTLRDRVWESLSRFKGFRLLHQGREESVRSLGH